MEIYILNDPQEELSSTLSATALSRLEKLAAEPKGLLCARVYIECVRGGVVVNEQLSLDTASKFQPRKIPTLIHH